MTERLATIAPEHPELFDAWMHILTEGSLSAVYLREHGVSWQVVEEFCGIPLLTAATYQVGRRFDLGGTVPSCVIEARDLEGEIFDLVAWPLRRPEKFATVFGRASLLGESDLVDAGTYALGSALDVYRTPLDWMRAGCRGAVLLDMARGARRLLDAPGPICGRDVAHGRAIADGMRAALGLDRIVVATGKAA